VRLYDVRVTSDLRTHEPAAGHTGAPVLMARPAPETDDRPPLAQRLCPPLPADRWGWIAPGVIAFVAGMLRFWRLGVPKDFVFDETYYAKDAWSLLKFGYEHSWQDKVDHQILAGTTNLLGDGPAFVVHPPAGKWVIALGEALAGFNPLGWRLMVALLGTISVLMIARIARRLTRSTLLGCVAGLLLAFDGLHFVMSRFALLDLILMFWILAAFGLLLIDRDRTRRKLAELVESGLVESGLVGAVRVGAGRVGAGRVGADRGRFGPKLGPRPYRIAAGVALGLATATKWSGLYAIAVFGLMTFLWDRGARRALGVRQPTVAAIRFDAVPAFASVVVTAVATYLVSWSGWFATGGGWDRHWADGRDSAFSFVPAPVRALWHYHAEMWNFHTHLDTPHQYQSSPWGWLIIARPVSYYFLNLKQGENGCQVDKCASAVLGIGTPVLWWTSVFALAYLLFRWLGRRDWRAGAVLGGVAATYLPWFMFTERTIFYFYGVVFVPYLVLAVTLMIGALLGDAAATPRRRSAGAAAAGLIVVLVLVNFLWLYPILSAEPIPFADWNARMWFRSWI
jgi:dolichyl-phosphate-mannose--protein O-mannosyl transferase